MRWKITLLHKTNMPPESSMEYMQEYFISTKYQGAIEDWADLLRRGLRAEKVVEIELQGIEPEMVSSEIGGLG
ncbi:MAG: hypothetical protein ACXAEN_22380 [Candidatus Thorarchaeota archaeon]|jgi:hypothetical protein